MLSPCSITVQNQASVPNYMSVTALWLLSTVADLQFCLQVCWATLKRQACFNGKRYFPFHILETTEPFWLKWKQNCIDTEQSKRAIKYGCIVRQFWKELLCKAGDSDREPQIRSFENLLLLRDSYMPFERSSTLWVSGPAVCLEKT